MYEILLSYLVSASLPLKNLIVIVIYHSLSCLPWNKATKVTAC